MRDMLENVWLKRCIAVAGFAYAAVITLLAYATFLYDLEFVSGKQSSFFIMYAVASVVFMVLMIYTREQFVTRLISVILLPVVFFLALFNFHNFTDANWILIIPPFIVALVMFFAAGTHETVKVIMGTIYLLLYVLGIVAYVVCNMLFGSSTVETTLDMNLDPQSTVYSYYKNDLVHLSKVIEDDNAISPDGKYRFYLSDVKDMSDGRVVIYVLPNGQDIKLKYFSLNQKGIRKTINSTGTRGVVPDVGWTYKENDEGKQELYLVYHLSPEDGWHESKVTSSSMPKQNYWEFLGISS